MILEQEDLANETQEYRDFVEKFKPKKTTDDCYTPQNVYDAVLQWAVNEYGLQGRKVLRPFYPGGDYENEDYPSGCVVIDNPPFSILSKICRFYDANGIDYFLFAPSLTLFSTNSGQSNYIVSGESITYANGANVSTSFVTNLGDLKVHIPPDLCKAIRSANDENTKSPNELPKYDYPDYVINSAILGKVAKRGIELKIAKSDATFIRAMDQQRKERKAIFGGGFLLSEKAAAEKAAAEKFKLSDREKQLIAQMSE